MKGLLAALAAAIFAANLLVSPASAGGNPINALANWATGDVAAAVTASTKYSGLNDQVGAACLKDITLLATIIHDHPLPVTLKLASDLEYGRLTQAQLNVICRNPACAQVWGDMANAAKAIQVLPLPIAFASICAKVPVVGLTMPAPAPVSTPIVPVEAPPVK